MSDLQDALDRRQQIRDELYDPQRDAFDTIVEAARLVANPDYTAAYAEWEHSPDLDAGHITEIQFVKRIVDAALGITEDTDLDVVQKKQPRRKLR